MKVLWFTNGPGLAMEYLTQSTESRSWSSCINREIVEFVDLSVAFYYPKYKPAFSYNNTLFYPICKKSFVVNAFKALLPDKFIDTDDIAIYLNIIDTVKPDLIHIHGTENPFACIIPYTKIPVVVSMQGIPSVIVQKYLSGLPSKYLKEKSFGFNLLKLLKGKRFVSGYRNIQQMAIREQRNLKHCKYIVGRTEWDRNVSAILAPESKYFGNDHRILADEYYNYKWKYPDDKDGFVVHTTISNNFYKGFETICLATFILRDLGFQITLQVIGISDKDEIYSATRKYLNTRFPVNGIKVMGKMSPLQIVQEMASAHLYVMPSHIENNSNSLCEAMLIGMPCLASNVGGMDSLIAHNQNGVLFKDGDAYELATKIVDLLENKEVLLKIAQTAYIDANERHNKQNIIQNLISIYKSI